MSEYESSGRTVKFNAGMFQAKRIHELQSLVNTSIINPLAMNDYFQVPNYQVVLSCLISLYHEAEPKLEDKQKENFNKIYNKIVKCFKEYPIIEEIRTTNDKKLILNNSYWIVYQKFLFSLESVVRGLLDKTGLNNPDYDDEDEL